MGTLHPALSRRTGLFEARQSLPGLILLALLAAETLRIVLERLIERFGNPS